MALIVKNLSYSYQDKQALKDISFTINRSDFLGITGPTGSGKTTLVNLLSSLLKTQEGTIENSIGKVGIVFQYPEYQLFEETVIKDVMFGPLNMGRSKEEAIKDARIALKNVGLDQDFEERSPFALSGGEKRRVAIAGVLAMNPDVLILDEPAAGLDPKMHREIFDLLKRMNQQGKTIIIVSHNINDIALYCNKALILDNGHQQAFGLTTEIPIKSDEQNLLEELKPLLF